MTSVSPSLEMMSLMSHTDKSEIILFRSNPEISHGSHSDELTGSLTHGFYHHCRQQSQLSQSGFAKYSISVSEPQIDHERHINGNGFNRDCLVLRTVEVQDLSLDYDNAMPSIARINNTEENGGMFDSVVHSINEHRDNSTPLPPLDSTEAVAEGGGSASGESGGRHLPSGGFKGGPGDSRILQEVSVSNGDGDLNFIRARAGSSSVADADKSEMGNDLFSARATGVSSGSSSHAEVERNKEGVNNKGRPSKGTVYDKYTGTRVTETTYGKLHGETAFIDQPNLSYGMVRTQPELQRCDKFIEKTGCTQAYDVDLAGTNAQADRYGAGGGGLSIIPPAVSVKRFGTGDIVDDERLITKTVFERASTEAGSTRESVVSSSTNVISTSATSVMSAGTKEECVESLGANSGTDFSTKSQLKERNSVANVYPVSQPLYLVTNGATKQTGVTTSHLRNGPSADTRLDLTTPHIPSTVVLLPELPMIVITPSIPEATSSPSPAVSSFIVITP